MFLSRGVISVGRLPEAAWQGFLSMVPAILILCFAWTIGGIINQLGDRIISGDKGRAGP